jgi:hypothetical protein
MVVFQTGVRDGGMGRLGLRGVRDARMWLSMKMFATEHGT